MLAVRLPEDLEARLDKVVKESGRSKSWFAREAIAERIADWEDYLLAEKRIADIKSGKSKTVSLEEVMARLGMED
jgi:RHH-type transcriptional regulator, rel operon repressor / antitoxin RelB